MYIYLSTEGLQANYDRIEILSFPQIDSLEGFLGWNT